MNQPMSGTLDLFYRGNRDYIQGSLVLSQSVAWYRENHAPAPGIKVRNATFSAIIRRPCTVQIGERALYKDPSCKTRIDLVQPNGANVSLAVLENSAGVEAPRCQDSAPRVTQLETTGKLAANAHYTRGARLEQFLQALIEANKRVHSETYPDARNIWFLSLFDVELPTEDDFFTETGTLSIENEMERPSKGRMASVNRVTVSRAERAPFELRLLFGYEV